MIITCQLSTFFSGAMWSKSPINFDWWTVEINFRVSGRGRIGADGLVIL